MHTTSLSLLLCIFLVLFFCGFICSDSSTFTLTNNCPGTIWEGTLAGSGMPQLPMTGFVLESGQSARIPSVSGWSGTGCMFDKAGMGTCLTGDRGGRPECASNGAMPPSSLFEITLGTGTDKDFYDVSVVDGYNLHLVVAPQGVYGECNATGCTSDINFGCPKELQVVGGNGEHGREGVIACRSACEAFSLDQYCCGGEFANSTTCRPSYYSAIFKRACLRAYSYAFDDRTSNLLPRLGRVTLSLQMIKCKTLDYKLCHEG